MPALRPAAQEMDARIRQVIANYTQKLAERTQHHLGCGARPPRSCRHCTSALCRQPGCGGVSAPWRGPAGRACKLSVGGLARYPYNLDFDFTPLEGLQRFSINNLGGARPAPAPVGPAAAVALGVAA
jgi:hypothetical protein